MLLVVDNDSLVMRPWVSILREEGYLVGLRNHADRALKAVEEFGNTLDCAIVDVMMPAPAGWEDTMDGLITGLVLARKIRELKPGVPVIFLSANMDQGILAKLRQFEQPSVCIPKLRLTDELLLNALRRFDVKPTAAPVAQAV